MAFVDPFDKFGVAPPEPLYMVDPDSKEPVAKSEEKKEEEPPEDDKPESDGEYEDEEYLYLEEPVSIGRSLRKFVNNPKFSDITFIVGEEKTLMYGHRTILAARSPYFRAMFFSQFVNRNERECTIDEPPHIFRAIIHCIYTDHCGVDAGNAVEILIAAKKYQIHRLIRKCTKYLKNGITGENACELYETTSSINEEESGVLTYIEDNAEDCFAADSFVDLSEENVLALVKSDLLAINEIDVFRAVVRWCDWQLAKVGMSGGSATIMGEARRSMLRQILRHIRFPIMHLDEFNSAVPQSGILSPSELLPLFNLLAKRDDSKTPIRENYHCSVCTFFNTGDRSVCQMCQAPAPPPGRAVKYVDWSCSICTFENKALRPKCDMCGSDRPEPTAHRSAIPTLRYPDRYPNEHHDSNTTNGSTAPSITKLLEYDAVFTWNASQQYPDPFCDNCAAYVDAGGGVIVGAIATNTGTYGMAGRFETELYSATTRGTQISSPATLVLPTNPRELAHPVFRNVAGFDGGPGSYRTGIRPTAGAHILGAWTDGTPLIVEKEGPRKRGNKPGIAMTLNFYPVSSGVNDQYWRRDSDGGLLILNVHPLTRLPRSG